jgi:Transglycosylase-like domain
LLTKRAHIAPVLLSSLALPTAALAAAGGGTTAATVAGAKVIHIAPLQRPVERFRRLVHVDAERIEAERRSARRRRHREAFATLPGGVSMATLEAIATCESGDDPTAISPGGTYRGKYQFDQSTWESVGGHGDPAAAPAAEQDYRAALLYARSGPGPWPVCG